MSKLGCRLTLCALGAFALSACAEPAPFGMRLTEVTPFNLPRSRETQLTLNGNFYVDVQVNFGSGSAGSVNDTFMAWLDNVALHNVKYVNSTTLQATFPANALNYGTHTLYVNAPDGTSAALQHAVMVQNY